MKFYHIYCDGTRITDRFSPLPLTIEEVAKYQGEGFKVTLASSLEKPMFQCPNTKCQELGRCAMPANCAIKKLH